MKSTLHCGAARVEITAKSEWYPLFSGFFDDDIKEDSYQVGSLDPQFARAIALQNDDTTILMVSLDHIAVPGGSEITKMISEATGVANENIFILLRILTMCLHLVFIAVWRTILILGIFRRSNPRSRRGSCNMSSMYGRASGRLVWRLWPHCVRRRSVLAIPSPM